MPAGGASLTASVDGTIEIPVGSSAGFTWNADSTTDTKHAVGPVPMALGTVSFTLGNGEPIAFAVYSVDDQSLDFYKRLDAPEPGDTFEGKVVTDVYTGFEENRYIPSPGNGGQNWLPDATNSTPWFSHHLDVTTVSVIDSGIRPKYLDCWFQNFSKCKTVDLNRLDMSGCSSLYTALSYCTSAADISVSSWDVSQVNDFTHAFLCCESLETLDLNGWNTSSAKIFHSTFNGCSKLKNLLIGPAWNFSHVWQCRYMFSRCTDLTIDCSEWDVSGINPGNPGGLENSWHFCFNYDAPSVVLPKAWQAGAFAVFSTDDGSLDFYKRSNCELPVAGGTFNGKAVTDVYTGFEMASYHLLGFDQATNNWDSCDTTTPWFDVRNNVTSINVVDQGIKPYNLAFFFRRFENLESADLVNFDLSETVSIDSLFLLCKSLKTVKIPGISRQCTKFKDVFAYCPVLTDLEFGNSDFSGGKNFYHMFNRDSSLLYDCTDWNVPLDAEHHGFNSVAPGVILPKPWQPTAFAVFSTDDGELDFYKREFKDLPKVGDTFEGKIVTEVYTGFEDTNFSIQTSDDKTAHDWTCTTLPWWNRRDSVKTATVVDTGITPISICGWFMRMSNLTTADLSNLDCVNTYTAWCAFLRCTSLTSLKSPKNFNPIDLSDFVYNCDNLKDLDTSTWNMDRCQNIDWAFSGCHSLETLPGAESWNTSSLNYTNGAFAYCNLLKLDCSDWKVQANADHKEFNHESPGVILPKVWQPIAFAVFSADDKSLDFYKREYKDIPKIGDTFNNKTVSEVYSDIEDYDFKISYETDPAGVGNAPWWNHRADILSVKVVDGIKPKNMCGWFFWFANVTSIDLGPIDTSEVTSLFGTFDRCFSLKTLNVSMMNTSKVTNMDCAFFCDGELTELDLSGWDFSNVYIFNRMFFDCKKLGILGMPSTPNFASHTASFSYMFQGCTNLTFDCSNWDVQTSADHTKFNYEAPGVILLKKWQ